MKTPNYYEKLLSHFDIKAYELFDYFTRITNADTFKLQEIINKVFTDKEQFTNKDGETFIKVNHKYIIYLGPENTGYYFSEYSSYSPLQQMSGILSPQLLLESNETQGANIFFLLKSIYGINDNNSISDIFRRINFIYDYQERILLHDKYHSFPSIFKNIISYKPLQPFNIDIDDIEKIYYENMEFYPYPIYFGFKKSKIYWYKTENSSIAFGIIYFFNDNGNYYILPISSWQFIPTIKYPGTNRPNNINEKPRLDLLLPPPPYLIYNIDKIKSSISNQEPIIIFPNELIIDIFLERSWNMDLFFIPTTWCGGLKMSLSKTDWEYINGKLIYILLDDRDKNINNLIINIKKSHTIFSNLNNKGIKVIGYIKYSKLIDLKYISDFNNNFFDNIKFIRWAYEIYGIILGFVGIEFLGN